MSRHLQANLKRSTASAPSVYPDAQGEKPEAKQPPQVRARRPSGGSLPPRAVPRDRSGSDEDSRANSDTDALRNRIVVGSRVLVDHEGLRQLGLSYTRVRIWQLMREGAFPKSISFGRQKPYWVLSEVEAWIEARFNARLADTDQHNAV